VDVSLSQLADDLEAEEAGSLAHSGSAGKTSRGEGLVGFAWLERLRWGSAFGQTTVLLFAGLVLGESLPWAPVSGLVLVTLVTNAGFALRPRFRPAWLMPAVLALDIVTLAILMGITGGPSNPFTIFFLVHVALAAMLLPSRFVWPLVALTVACFGLLFLAPSATLSTHAIGMWVSYGLAATFVAHFVGRVARAFRERDQRLAEMAHLAHQNEKLVALSAFSANAAHELGTPLATIALASQELTRMASSTGVSTEIVDDARLIHDEAMKCRAILGSISARAGESVGEMFVSCRVDRLFASLLEELGSTVPPPKLTFEPPSLTQREVHVPQRTLAQMLANLVRNGHDAQAEANLFEPLEVRVREESRFLVCLVSDRGKGIANAVEDRLGEPFVTTKAVRGGLGLGVYLARSFAERLGGTLTYSPRPEGSGTNVELRIPFDAPGRSS
jgi:two-component system, sensor histidine kinase RegB